MAQRIRDSILRVYNRGTQMIPVHLRPPAGDFYRHEQVVYLQPGKHVDLPASHVNDSQLRNLKSTRQLQVTILDS